MTVFEKQNRIQSESGFSLIEVAIALIVIGLLMTPILHTYNLYIKSRQLSISQGVTNVVNSALIKYVEKHDAYPKPANPSIAQGNPNFGTANTAAAGWPVCTATSTVVCQTSTNTYGGGTVLVGDVPFATLGLPFKSILDGYNRKLTYAVTLPLTVAGSFDNGIGAIEVVDSTGTSIYTGTSPRSHFVVVSHGENTDGAFTLGGVRSNACGTNATGLDFENCNNDGLFRNNINTTKGLLMRNYATGSTYFDDFVKTTNTIVSGLWNYIPNSAQKMQSSNLGNVYVGACATTPCIPKSHVDVNGDVRGNKILTARICNKTTGDCVSNFPGTNTPREHPASKGWFSPMMLTGAPTANPTDTTNNPADATTAGYKGAGIRCYDHKGLKGVQAYDEVCAGSTATPYFAGSVTISNSCGAGTYANGITISGTTITLSCAAP